MYCGECKGIVKSETSKRLGELFLKLTHKHDKMNYGDKLNLPEWQRRRLQIMERDGFCCTRCGNGKIKLEVHHKDYFTDKEPWEYHDSDLQTLCFKCHGKEFKREKYENQLIYALRNAGFTAMEILSLSCYLPKYPGLVIQLRSIINGMINSEL